MDNSALSLIDYQTAPGFLIPHFINYCDLQLTSKNTFQHSTSLWLSRLSMTKLSSPARGLLCSDRLWLAYRLGSRRSRLRQGNPVWQDRCQVSIWNIWGSWKLKQYKKELETNVFETNENNIKNRWKLVKMQVWLHPPLLRRPSQIKFKFNLI